MRSAAIVVALFLTSVTVHSFAQSVSDKATAQALFDAAKRLLKEGKPVEACPKFAESQRLDPAPGTLLNLADCYEKSGMTASAWATWLEAAAATHNAGQSDRERMARERADGLKGKLVSITVSVPDANRVEGLAVKRNSDSVGVATWGIPVPVDPGAYTIVATAKGFRSWQTSVSAKSGGLPVVVTVPVLEREATAAAAPASPTPVQPSAAPALAPVAPAPAPLPAAAPYAVSSQSAPIGAKDAGPPASSPQRPISYIVMGLGVAGLAVGTVFGLEAKSKNDDSLAQCRTETSCTQGGYDLRQRALDSAAFSTVAFGIGAAALVGGIVLYATAPSTSSAPTVPKQAAWSLGPEFSRSGGGLSVKGVF